MATALEVQAWLDALLAARATGALTVRTADGRTVTYRSDAELVAAMGDLHRQLATLAGETVTRFVRVGHASGIE